MKDRVKNRHDLISTSKVLTDSVAIQRAAWRATATLASSGGVAFLLEDIAVLATLLGQSEVAFELLGAADSLREAIGAPPGLGTRRRTRRTRCTCGRSTGGAAGGRRTAAGQYAFNSGGNRVRFALHTPSRLREVTDWFIMTVVEFTKLSDCGLVDKYREELTFGSQLEQLAQGKQYGKL